jgi:hypothetical protein
MIVAMSGYLLSLDDLCNQLCQHVRALTHHVEEAEVRWRKSRLGLTQAETHVANVESRVALAEENLREQAGRHSKLFRNISLTDRAKRKDHHPRALMEPTLDAFQSRITTTFLGSTANLSRFMM